VNEISWAREDRTDQFLGLSAALTGYSRLELLGTAMVGEYLQTLSAVLPAGLLDELLDVYEQLPTSVDREAVIASQILDHLRLGPVARNLILLWYTGAWTALSGDSPLDKNHVVSAEAYLSGLQWVVAGAHPAGGRQQGYGAWSLTPEGAARERR
jgi:hypothetical protein